MRTVLAQGSHPGEGTMKEKNRIVIIGGVAAGPKAAARARRRDPNADITIVERGELLSYAGCGLPYYVQGVIEDARELRATPTGAVRDADFLRDAKFMDGGLVAWPYAVAGGRSQWLVMSSEWSDHSPLTPRSSTPAG